MALVTMYPGIENSPETMTVGGTAADATAIHVAATSVLPAAPNYLILGTENAEIVYYPSAPVGGVYSGCTRGVNGTTARYWPDGTVVARRLCAIDLNTIQANIIDVNGRIGAAAPSALDDMTDVVLTAPLVDKMALRYDTTTSKWVNEPFTPADIAAATASHLHTGVYAENVHAARHATAGGDAVTPADIGAEPAIGTLTIGKGGTGTTTAPAAGKLLIGNSSGGYTVANLTAGTNVTITNGNGTITIAASGAGGGSTTLAALTDCSISAPAVGQTLRWNGTDWVNDDTGSDDADTVDGMHAADFASNAHAASHNDGGSDPLTLSGLATVSLGTVAGGDILWYNSDTARWNVLHAGTAGYHLTTHGAGVAPTWEA